jgi:molybdate transport system substrate-binding protein
MHPWPRRQILAASVALGAIAGWRRGIASTEAPVIAAAATLKFALDEIAPQFQVETGREVKITYGSSGNFTRQILQGAPFQMFLSADEGFVFQLADAGRTVDRGVLYGEGRIVLFAPHGSPLRPDTDFSGLRAALGAGRIQRFAIANPEHAPYGRAAEQALKSQGLWEAMQPRLVIGENAAQAAQFATSGSTQGGIFAYSQALAPAVGRLGTYAVLPADWHGAMRQRMVLLKNAGDTARSFHAFVQTGPARAVLRKYGFILPGEIA